MYPSLTYKLFTDKKLLITETAALFVGLLDTCLDVNYFMLNDNLRIPLSGTLASGFLKQLVKYFIRHESTKL